ncbi:MAG: TetR/AcrR family transcriptional regulator [Saprospiraceae bacterium]|nr:TetR/AcrR family transcriptional regulator [Saprospiraceae bacterium]
MNKKKELLLKIAKRLFTEYGVAEVSLRQIAAEVGISHSNLIYHFPSKNDLIIALHHQLMEKAIALNQQVKTASHPLEGLLQSTQIGFTILYEYRFLMIDLPHILRDNKILHNTFLDLEKLRADMYSIEIQKAVDQNLMRQELYQGEYTGFIEHIKIFSDAWIASSAIYDSPENNNIIEKYVKLFMGFFYPYLTDKGRSVFDDDCFKIIKL